MRTTSGVNPEETPASLARRSRLRVAFFGAIVAALVVLPGLGIGTLWDNSETAYGEVAREILLTHDAIVMHLNNAAWFVQPPLFFWFAAIAASLFGSASSLAYRLPAAIATIAMSTLLARFVRRYAHARTARYAALILATMLMQAVIGRLAVMDAMLDAFIMVTMLAGYRALSPQDAPGARGGSVITAAIAAALGVLTKGPVALAIPLIVLGPWILWERRYRPLARPPASACIIAVAAFVCIATPWFMLLGAAEGGRGLGELIVHYTFGRYVGTIENQTGPIYYYLPVFVLGIFPWTTFVLAALRDACRPDLDAVYGERAPLLRFGSVWTLVPLVFFSLAKTKLPNYIAVSLPGAAIVCAVWFDDALARRRGQAFVAAAAVPALIGLLGVAVVVFAQNMRLGDALARLLGAAYAFIAVLFCGSIACAIALRRRSTARRAPYLLGAAAVVAMLIVALGALSQAEAFKPVPPLARVILQERRPGDLIALQGVNGENALMFYTLPPIAVLDSPDVKAATPQSDPSLVLCSAPRIFLIAPVKRPIPDPTYGRRRRLVAVSLKDALFFIDGPPCETSPE